jgi:predicted Na+-dependent transporter
MPTAILAFCGRHGTHLMAAGIFLGLAAQPLAHLLRPTLPTLVFLLTVGTMVRIDWPAVVVHTRRPGRLALVALWILVLSPAVMTIVAHALDLPHGLTQSLVVWAASPPMLSAAAVAYLLGLDASLALVGTVPAMLLTPLTLPPLALGLLGLSLQIGVFSFMGRLALFVGGAAAVALVLRHLLGEERVARRGTEINGANVLILITFAVAIMDGVPEIIVARPAEIAGYVAAAFGASLGFTLLSAIVFAGLDRSAAGTIALIGGNRNMAMVWATLGTEAPPEMTLFLVAIQLPIYISPLLTRPLYRRVGAVQPAPLGTASAR